MFFRSIPLFTILGFRVRLDLGWLLLATLVVVSRAQVFSAPPFSLEAPSAVALGMFFAVGLLLSIVLHELSHSLVARRFGIEIRGITLFILGGVSEMEEEPRTAWSEFMIAIVGPLSSFLIAGVAYVTALGGEAAGLAPAIVQLLLELAFMNMLLGVFNLVPAFPLDGGRVLRSVLWGLRPDVGWASRVAGRIGQGFAILMMVGGVMLVFSGAPGMIMLPLIGWFIYRSAMMPARNLALRSRLESATVAAFVDARPVVVPADSTVANLVRRMGLSGEDDLLPVVDDGRIVGLVSLATARGLSEEVREARLVSDVALPLPGEAVVSTGMSAEEALRRMQRLQMPALLVVDASRLVGVVRWQDLLRFAQSTA